jgi:hypothetical protein
MKLINRHRFLLKDRRIIVHHRPPKKFPFDGNPPNATIPAMEEGVTMKQQSLANCAAACLAIASLAQTTAPSSTAKELQQLRAENEALRQEIASLKAKLAAASPASQTQPAKTHPLRTFTTMMDVLTNCPADLRPQAKAEWYKFTEGKFLDWAREQFVGLTIDTSLQYPGGKTSRNIFVHAPGQDWMKFAGSFTGKKFTCFGAEHEWSVRYPQMTFDEDGAKKFDAIKPGTLFKVKGTIKSVAIQKMNYTTNKLPSYSFSFELEDFDMTPPK